MDFLGLQVCITLQWTVHRASFHNKHKTKVVHACFQLNFSLHCSTIISDSVLSLGRNLAYPVRLIGPAVPIILKMMIACASQPASKVILEDMVMVMVMVIILLEANSFFLEKINYPTETVCQNVVRKAHGCAIKVYFYKVQSNLSEFTFWMKVGNV